MKKIFSDEFSSVYFFEDIDKPNHPSDGLVKAALREFLCAYSLNCKDMEIFYDLWTQKEAYTKWKKGKIAKNLGLKVEKDMTLLIELPSGITGYLCHT